MTVRTRWWAVAAAAALVVMAAIVVTTQGQAEPDATTAKPVTPAPVPEQPRRVSWTWQVPGAAAAQDDPYAQDDEDAPSVQQVAAAGAGVVVLTDDGVTALDGRTGKERWHYRLNDDDAETTDLLTSRRGGWVALVYSDDEDDTRHLVALDAMTGRRGMRVTLGDGGVWMAADGVLVSDAATVTTGHDIRTGQRLWSYRLPKGCLRSPKKTDERSTVVRDAVVLGTVCAPADGAGEKVLGTLRVLALDARTGRQRWQHAESMPREDSTGLAWAFHELEVEGSPDGRFVNIKRDTETLLDASSGKVLLDPETMSEGEIREYGTDWVVVGYYTGSQQKRRYPTVRIDVHDASRKTVTNPLLRPGEGLAAAKALAGDRLLGLATITRSTDETEESGAELELTAIEGGSLRPVRVNAGPSPEEDDGDLVPCNPELAAAPGAIVATCTGYPRLTGLT